MSFPHPPVTGWFYLRIFDTFKSQHFPKAAFSPCYGGNSLTPPHKNGMPTQERIHGGSQSHLQGHKHVPRIPLNLAAGLQKSTQGNVCMLPSVIRLGGMDAYWPRTSGCAVPALRTYIIYLILSLHKNFGASSSAVGQKCTKILKWLQEDYGCKLAP